MPNGFYGDQSFLPLPGLEQLNFVESSVSV